MLKFLFLGCVACVVSGSDFKTVYQWKSVNYDFPNETLRNEYTKGGKYIPEHNLPLGLHVWKDKMFVTVPRWRKGVVANLNYIPMNNTLQSPSLIPYPDWETNDVTNPDGIVSIFRVRSDSCGRLWGVDTGLDDAVGEEKQIKPPTLVTIDLEENKIIQSYTIPESVRTENSFFVDLAVDVDPNDCNDAHVYISDIGYGLVVYSLAKNDSWRFKHNYFGYDPLNGDFNVKGIHFQWQDGIFGLTLSPTEEDGNKTLYFHAMSGITEFSTSTKILKDKSEAENTKYEDFQVVGNKGPLTQGASSLIDPNSMINYFTQVNRDGIACWNTNVELNPSTFILAGQDNETLVFPQDLSIDPQTNTLYVLSNNLQKLLFSELNLDEENFFITAAKLESLEPICNSVPTSATAA